MGVFSYAVSWQEPAAGVECGRLEVHADGLLFEGPGGLRTVSFDELAAVRVTRSPDERLTGRPTLVLERREGEAVRVASVDRAGVVLELAERLATAVPG